MCSAWDTVSLPCGTGCLWVCFAVSPGALPLLQVPFRLHPKALCPHKFNSCNSSCACTRSVPARVCEVLRRLAQPSPTQGTSLRRVQLTAKDEEVLEYLADVAVEDLEPEVDEDGDEMGGFKLSFTFAPNPYFDNETLVRPQLLPGVRRACEIFRGANFLSRTCGGRQGPVGRMCVLCVLPLCQHLSGAPTLADTHGVHPADKDVLHLRGGRRAHAEPRGGHRHRLEGRQERHRQGVKS